MGSTDLTLTLDASSGTPSARLFTPTLGTFDFQGTMTPESGGLYLSGALMQGGVSWSSLKAHVSTLKARGVVSAGPLQWTLDLRR